MTTDLSGATSPGEWGAYPSTPGELAARWNGMGFEARREFVEVMVANARAAHDCWAMQHVPGVRVQRLLVEARAKARAAALGEAAHVLEQVGHIEASLCVDGMAASERWDRAERGR